MLDETITGELQHAFELVKPKIVFVSISTLATATKVAKRCRFIEKLVVFGGNKKTSDRKGCISYNSFVQNPKVITKPNEFQCEPQSLDEVCLILYSSGTTGLAKGVQLTQKNIMFTIAQFTVQSSPKMDAEISNAIILSVGPWSHSFGCLALIVLPLLLKQVIYLPKFVDTDFLAAIQKYRVTSMHVVPPLMNFLAKSPIVSRYDLTSLKSIICGAAPLSKELEMAVQNRLGIPFVRQGYGMTESTVALIGQTDDKCKPGSVGGLRPGVSARIVDVQTGIALGPNEQGEMQFTGENIMKGYVGDEAATLGTIDEDGWLHTGDIGYYDEDGEFFIVDRIKELIKYKGFQVPPAEIEGLLLQHASIIDAGVVGVPDERAGELPMAFVVRANGVSLSAKEVIDFVAERSSVAKRLHGGVRFVATIPRNVSGKILRRELRELLKKPVSKL